MRKFSESLWSLVRRRAGLDDNPLINGTAAAQAALDQNDPDKYPQLRIAYVPFNITSVFSEATGKVSQY